MTVTTTYPGVYIDEFAPGAPIQGVSTSNAAFIGVASRGDLNLPTKITSWDQFRVTFGDQPVPGFYLWYAVRGYFENGGQVCYIVRASNGAYAEWEMDNSEGAPQPLMHARSRLPGAAAPTIDVTRKNLIAGASLYAPATTVAAVVGREIQVASVNDAALFRPGDWITIAAAGERAQIIRIVGDTIRIATDFATAPVAGDAVRLADSPVGFSTFRILPAAPIPTGVLVPGTILTIKQGANADSAVVASVQAEHLPGPVTTYRVTFRQGLANPYIFDGTANTVVSEEFDLVVTLAPASTTYSNLSMDPEHPRYVLDIVNADLGGLIRVDMIEPPRPVGLPLSLPRTAPATVTVAPSAEDLTTMGDAEFLAALDTLQGVKDANIIAIPDSTSTVVQQGLIAHCELLGDRFGVLDAQPGLESFGAGSIEAQRQTVDSTRGYAALYYPWLRVPPVGAGDLVMVPPSGHVCGIFARSDNTRGVHKAPANEIVNGALAVERSMSDIEQGQLNLEGIDVIRVFNNGGRPIVWGARTTATDLNWQYVNIRRLFIFLEQSIEVGIRWAVFEPNNLALWQKLRRTITAFLTQVWRDGALFGAKAEEAFYVRIDEVLNPFSEQALGRLHIEIGVRPSYPAEFIIVRIGIWDGGSDVTEG